MTIKDTSPNTNTIYTPAYQQDHEIFVPADPVASLLSSTTPVAEEEDLLTSAAPEYANALVLTNTPSGRAMTNPSYDVPQAALATVAVTRPSSRVNVGIDFLDEDTTPTTPTATVTAVVTTPTTTATAHTPPPSSIRKPNFEAMKRRRVQTQMLGGWTGGVAGAVVLGPFGIVLGAVVGNKLTKAVAKRRENRLKTKYARNVAEERDQRYADRNTVTLPTYSAVSV